MVLPLIDLIMSVMPLRPSVVVWRFGAVGLFASAVGAPLLILFFIYALAVALGDRKAIVFCGSVAAVMSVLLVTGAGAFALDALQMKARVQPVAMQRFYMASMQALLKLGLQAIAALVLTVSAFRAAKVIKATAKAERQNPSAMLLARSGDAPRSAGAAPVDVPPASVEE
jgi:hypothetical protein